MRALILVTLFLHCSLNVAAQQKPTKAETIKWLQEKLTHGQPRTTKDFAHQNSIAIFLNCSRYKPSGDLNDHDFNTHIESTISWEQDGMTVQNEISRNGLLRETYTYQVPFFAILSATITNCKKNTHGEVNAYHDRPVFISVRNNTTKITQIRFDKTGKTIASTKSYRNSIDADWNSVIPIAVRLDQHPVLQEKVLAAFARLAKLINNKII